MKKFKLLLIGLFNLIGLGSFCSAGIISDYISIAYSGDVSLSANSTTNAIDLGSAPNKTLCITLSGSLGNNNYVNIGFYGNTTNVASDSQEYRYDQVGKTVCMYANKRYFNINNPKSTTPTINYEAYFLNDLLNTTIPNQNCPTFELTQVYGNKTRTGFNKVFYQASSDQVISNIYIQNGNLWVLANTNTTNYIKKSDIDSNYCESNNLCSQCDTGSILSGYILASSVDQNYCFDNGLCPSCPIIDQEYCEDNFNLIDPENCPSSPSGSGSSWSAVWINNIQHLGASNIFMSIPEEISRDYSYVDSGSSMEIDVEGYNVDYDYINGIIETQNSKPSSEDFNDIITRVLPLFVPGLVIILFIYFVFKFIKKMF